MDEERAKVQRITALAQRQFSHLFDDLARIVEDDKLTAEEASHILRFTATTLRIQASKLDPEGVIEDAS
jgi:hypothetical protein